MITKTEYKALKLFKNNSEGITCKEFTDNEDQFYTSKTFRNFEFKGYIEPNYDTWKDRRNTYILAKKGVEAIEFYEKWLNYPHTCEQEEKHTGNKYVIIEHRSGCFGTGIYHMGYTSNLGFTKDLNYAKLYDEHKEAEKELEDAIKGSPTKYQNPEDYEFSIEEVNISVNVKLPKTFVCKDCGEIYPIKDYAISMYCPNSWNTGVCQNCIGIRKRKEHEAIYGRNKRGVFDYDSID
jgi:uncharacterized protein YbaR (Trm112 family)